MDDNFLDESSTESNYKASLKEEPSQASLPGSSPAHCNDAGTGDQQQQQRREHVSSALRKAADTIDRIQQEIPSKLTARRAETLRYISENERDHLDSLHYQERILIKVINTLKEENSTPAPAVSSSPVTSTVNCGNTKHHNKELELRHVQQTIQAAKAHATKNIIRHPKVQPNLEKLDANLDEWKSVLLQTSGEIMEKHDGTSNFDALKNHVERIVDEALQQKGARTSSVHLKKQLSGLDKSFHTKRRQSQMNLGSNNKSAMLMQEKLRQLQKQGSTLRRQEVDSNMETIITACFLEEKDLRQQLQILEEKVQIERQSHPVLISNLNSKLSAVITKGEEAEKQYSNKTFDIRSKSNTLDEAIASSETSLIDLNKRKHYQNQADQNKRERRALTQKLRLAAEKASDDRLLASNKIKRIIKRCLKRRKAEEEAAKKKKPKKNSKKSKK
jgi:hypothetical protein